MAHSALNTVGQWEGELHRRLEAEFNGRSAELHAHPLIREARGAIETAAAIKMDISNLLGAGVIIETMKRGKRRKLPVSELSTGFLDWKMQDVITKLRCELDGRERVEAYFRRQASSPEGSRVTT